VRQLLATARRSPASLVGTLVALTVAAAMVTVAASIIGTADTTQPAVQRLAGSTVIVVGEPNVRIITGHGENRETTSYRLTSQRRVPVTLAGRLRSLPGVASVVADVSIPITLLTASGPSEPAEDATAHGWAAAMITPVHLGPGTPRRDRTRSCSRPAWPARSTPASVVRCEWAAATCPASG
jgi:putative ABC transport system permease protein